MLKPSSPRLIPGFIPDTGLPPSTHTPTVIAYPVSPRAPKHVSSSPNLQSISERRRAEAISNLTIVPTPVSLQLAALEKFSIPSAEAINCVRIKTICPTKGNARLETQYITDYDSAYAKAQPILSALQTLQSSWKKCLTRKKEAYMWGTANMFLGLTSCLQLGISGFFAITSLAVAAPVFWATLGLCVLTALSMAARAKYQEGKPQLLGPTQEKNLQELARIIQAEYLNPKEPGHQVIVLEFQGHQEPKTVSQWAAEILTTGAPKQRNHSEAPRSLTAPISTSDEGFRFVKIFGEYGIKSLSEIGALQSASWNR